MSIETAQSVVMSMAIYFAIGLLVGIIYAVRGAGMIDPAAKGMPLQARLIIVPGVTLLWPIMLVKLFTQKEPPIS